ncbi:hypothetical protein EWM64_g398 [Hericium alpestre]|uniref:Cytochrome P450 n=1 Tax=Hericium alpestre TaxID=135208 RepID=A0A4Z0ACV1_9AGAM|nr:hypothetical protein EWM64_g398 [Hericium alpestre]
MTTTTAIFSFLLIISLAALFKRRRPTTPFPPSLPRLPILGNFFQIPKQTTWEAYASWPRKFNSDLISVWVFGQHTIIINSKKAAQDLLEQRSAIYSDKLQTTMISLTGWDFSIVFLPYADKWRAYRRVFQRLFRESAISEYQPLQKTNVESLLRALYAQPNDVTETVRTNIAALTMNLVYGYDVVPGDPIVDCLDTASTMIVNALLPGAMIADALPALRYLPEWLPGMYFKRYARKCHNFVDQMIHAPMGFVRRKIADGTAKPSLISSMMGDNDANGEAFMGEIGAAIYTAMADTGNASRPGRHAAMSTLFISVAHLLAVFNTRPKKDEKGNNVPINVTYSGGASSRPSSFKCSFQLRDDKAKAMLEKIADNVPVSHNDSGF